ncbi:MarR family winged helix-turn-helix transcriptional regulator [Quadrisphaera oryzae]|uniref:MarR family winged helix-turn-helix transcriptional regulator n=1 Tax=Quadrisphaera TaxID=317661 RepID=UPI001648DACA|nr:MarR family transcriptional regulator [Quadrisphaera sp. RL12-1S]MBC3763286.1 MarR family transcriptional regulator [Quadrisphaera sp. RL12-1S]
MTHPADAATATAVWRTMTDLVVSQDRRERAAAAVGLSFLRLRALRRVAEHPLTLRELAAAAGVDAPYATVVVDDLAARGYVTREPHPTDRRARLVTITDSGLAAARRGEAILRTPPPELAALPEADLLTLQRILARVVAEGPEEGPAPRS